MNNNTTVLENVIENLDGFFDPADLIEHGHKVRDIPDCPRAYVSYCFTKANAMLARIEGRIATALELEKNCDKLYARIPADWKW